MKQRILIALLTVVLIGAGFAAGIWTERNACKVPKPPAVLGEMSPSKTAAQATTRKNDPNPAELAAEIERLRPQIESFRERLSQIDYEMDQEIKGILNAEQATKFDDIVKYYADRRAKEAANWDRDTPLTLNEIVNLQQQPLYKMLGIVVVPLRMEWNTRDLNLTPEQTGQLREILVRRRQKFLDLVDASPPPSLMLSRLAPVARRLVTTAPEQAQ